MRLLLDTNVDLSVVPALAAAGHDVRSVVHEMGGDALDSDIIAFAERASRIIVTHDRDFGDLAVHHEQPHAGIVYLRLRTGDASMIARRITAVLHQFESEFPVLLVVSESNVRVRR